MLVVFKVLQGNGSVDEIVLGPAESARIGSDPQWCDYAFEDNLMSAVHFVLYCDQSNAYVRDLNTRGGTRRNGTLITSAQLNDGDRVTAGNTTFQVVIEKEDAGKKEEKAEEAPEEQAHTPVIQRLLAGLRQVREPVFLLIDCARDGKILPLLGEHAADAQTLFNGPDLGAMIPFSPHLVAFEKEGKLIEDLLVEGWGKPWMVFVLSREPFSTLREHLRELLMAENPDGKQVFFRYYDPRILRRFLPVCTPAETRQFFGPVVQFWVEDEKPEFLLQFAPSPKGAEMQRFSLTEPLTSGSPQAGAAPPAAAPARAFPLESRP